MKFEKTRVMNFEGAVRGMRNPMNSWEKSDSYFGIIANRDEEGFNILNKMFKFEIAKTYPFKSKKELDQIQKWLQKQGVLKKEQSAMEVAYIGSNDLSLMKKLICGGSEHRKFLRQIFVSVDITAPIYWYKEFDTYKVGITENSTSTMHKLAETPITLENFEINDLYKDSKEINIFIEEGVIPMLESLRQKYNETKEKIYWKELIRWLPESYLQKRTITTNYENILNICKQREDHKLIEWKYFIDWAKSLPYANELLFLN